MNATASNPMIESYFTQLGSKLSDLPQKQREDFLRELQTHVMDRLAQTTSPTDEDCRSVLTALGTPEEIARQYRVEVILNRSSWKISPITVLRTLLRWSVPGIQGITVVCVAMIGYALAFCFYVGAALKPFFPRNVGAFISNHGLNLAHFPDPPTGQDVLGSFFIPAAVVVGYLLTLGTTLLLRFINSRSRRIRKYMQ